MSGRGGFVADPPTQRINAALITAEQHARGLVPGSLAMHEIRALQSAELRAKTVAMLCRQAVGQAQATETRTYDA